MMSRVRWGTNRALLAALLLLPFQMLLASAAGAGSTDLPSKVIAVYRVSFSLLGDIGWFRFSSSLDGGAYTLAANSKIDTAIFDYRGSMTSTGSVHSKVATPTRHKFSYKQKAALSKKKKKALSIDFNGSGVEKVNFVPPEDRSKKKDIIQVTSEQLKNVLDPLSGVLALSLGDFAKPCERRLPIFDGKQRFDIVFTPTGRTTDGAGHPVCRVRLLPISGHKKGEGAASVINGPIEVVMRPVPKANILVPYRVTVPTIVGTAELASERVDITMPDRQRFALRR